MKHHLLLAAPLLLVGCTSAPRTATKPPTKEVAVTPPQKINPPTTKTAPRQAKPKATSKPTKRVASKPVKRVAVQPVAMVWRTNFDAAMKEARRTRKPVFVDFYTDWCGACKYLDQTTYRDAKFVRESRNWVMVKVNAEKGARNAQIARQYKLEGYPTLLMLDARGKRLNQVAGAYPTGMMLAEMQKAQQKMGWLSAQVAKAPLVG